MSFRRKSGGNRPILPIACALGLTLALAGCATPRDIEAFGFACTHGLTFQARLYSDMVALDGARGHDLLPREKDGPDGSLRFGNQRVQAVFGLGMDRRLATLRYADIPQTIHCERANVQFGKLPAALRGPALTGAVPAAAAGSVAPGSAAPESAASDSAALAPIRASQVPGQKPKLPPEPPDPKDVIYTNIRFGGGPGYN